MVLQNVLFKRVKKVFITTDLKKINLYILLKAFFLENIQLLRDNYKYHYIKHVRQ